MDIRVYSSRSEVWRVGLWKGVYAGEVGQLEGSFGNPYGRRLNWGVQGLFPGISKQNFQVDIGIWKSLIHGIVDLESYHEV